MAVSPDGTLAYVTNSEANTVSVVDTTTNTVIANIIVGDRPEACGSQPPDGNTGILAKSDGTVVVMSFARIDVVDQRRADSAITDVTGQVSVTSV